MPAPRDPTGAPRLAVALEATPLLGTPTGVGRFCRLALEALAARGDVALRAFAVTWRRRGELAAVLPPGVGAGQRAMPARPLHAAWRVVDRPVLEHFLGPLDCVHGTNFVVPPTARAGRVVTVHDLTTLRFPELCHPATLGFPALVRKAAARGALVHTPTAAVAEEVVALLGVPAEQVAAVPHGVPPAPALDPRPARQLLGLEPAVERYVLAVGTVEPRKDLPGLVAAFDEIAAAHPETALVLVGPDGWGSEALADALARARHRERVRRLGYLEGPALARVLAEAACLAYPSRYEGFGLPPLEALAAGVPVVATAVPAVAEVVGEAAVLVPVGDVSALAHALDRVLDGWTPEGRPVGAMVEAGRARAAEFRWDRTAEGLVALYRRAAASRAGARAGRP
ncbi:glycosyltransferase family 4 protein [Aciditerrimonas ferrireducens]|uniref:glycosyltransferase family 4 protein n=1 Tax=Aciditerrimonas ferrireducens TaxID=667306 RepID=UPI002002EE7D|nr:glycosyltransferase family 1 protein [Aciditerrimonas ferrireducens]MCK4177427.1 glycosyltransferase family 4 protein [Aciditerrimonas ferrireducens]